MAKYYINAMVGANSNYPYDNIGNAAPNFTTLFKYGNVQPGDDVVIYKPTPHVDKTIDQYDVADMDVVIPFSVNIYVEGNVDKRAHVYISDSNYVNKTIFYFNEGSTDCNITGITFYKSEFASKTNGNGLSNVSFVKLSNTSNITFSLCNFLTPEIGYECYFAAHPCFINIDSCNNITISKCYFRFISAPGAIGAKGINCWGSVMSVFDSEFVYDPSYVHYGSIFWVYSRNLFVSGCNFYPKVLDAYGDAYLSAGGPYASSIHIEGGSAGGNNLDYSKFKISHNVFCDFPCSASMSKSIYSRFYSITDFDQMYINNNVFYVDVSTLRTNSSACGIVYTNPSGGAHAVCPMIYNNIFYSDISAGTSGITYYPIKDFVVSTWKTSVDNRYRNNLTYNTENSHIQISATVFNISGVDPKLGSLSAGISALDLNDLIPPYDSVCHGRGMNGTTIGLYKDGTNNNACVISDTLYVTSGRGVLSIDNLTYESGERINTVSIKSAYYPTSSTVNSNYSVPEKYTSAGPNDYYYNVFNLSAMPDVSAIPFATSNVLYGADVNSVLGSISAFCMFGGLQMSSGDSNYWQPEYSGFTDVTLFGKLRSHYTSG